jgi:hypothetical protein
VKSGQLKRKTPLRRPAARPSVPVGTWSLLVVDNEPIRQKAQRDYQKATRDLNKAKNETERFHSQDKPLFTRWLHANFGALLTEMRDLQVKLHETQDLVNEVQQEYFFGGHSSIGQAYRTVLHRRSHPEEEQSTSEPTVDPEEDADFRQNFEDAMREAAEEFQGRFQRAQPSRPRQTRDRLKQLYRKLARRLHPDNGRKLSPRETDLWHRTQAAYDAGHVEILETILSLLDVDENGTRTTAISTLLRLTADLKKTLRGIKRELTALRRDIAWNFSQREDHLEIRRSTEAMLQADREKLVWLLTKYKSQIERWETQSHVKGKRVRSRRSNWMDEEWF